MSKASFWQRGETLDYKNSGAAVIEANTIIEFGTRVGIAGMDIAPGETGSLHVSGVFEFPKAASIDVTAGAEVYLDASSGNITTTSTSNTKAGFAVEEAGAADTTVLVKINA